MSPPNQLQRNRLARQDQLVPDQQIEAPLVNQHLNAAPQQVHTYGMTQVNNYQELFHHLQTLSPSPVAANAPAQNENLGYKARKRREKEIARQKEQYREFGKAQRLLHLGEVSSLSLLRTEYGREEWKQEKVSRSQLTREETMRKVLEENDYSNFENLDAVMRNVVASSALAKFMREYHVTERSDPETLCRQIQQNTEGVSGLLNPGLRLGLSLAQRTAGIPDGMKELFRQLDEAMSTAVMVATLTHEPVQADVEQYFRDKQAADPTQKADEAIAANQAQQIQIAKRLLLMQLSTFKKISDTGASTDWDRSMAVALSHCSRVVLTLPRQDGALNSERNHANMWRAILTTNGENTAQDNHRGGSTHSIKRRKVNDNAVGSKEKKVLVNLVGQRGMNCAIGGLGNAGVGGKTLCNDGSCGHFYSMYKEADATHYGTMLMGLESDANGVTNQMGHTHDMHATPEKASSLGGQRIDEVGKKYGGRQCDLTDLSALDITMWMERLESYMQAVHRNVIGPDNFNREDYNRIMGMLAGKAMTRDDWSYLREKLVVPEIHGGDR